MKWVVDQESFWVFLDSFLVVFWTVTFLANLLLNVNILLTLDENLLEKNKGLKQGETWFL